MKRRALLAALGTTTALTAGCLDQSSGGQPTEEPPKDGTDSPTSGDGTGTPDDTTTETPDPPRTGTPTVPDSRFEDVACPSFADTDRTVCFHTLGNGSAPVTVEPTVELFQPSTGDGTVETVEFVLHNRSDDTFGLNPYAWTIHRRTEGGWERVAPDATPEPWLGIHGGGTYRWVLAVETHPSPQGDERMDIVQDLDDGTYAFAVDGTFGDGPNSGTRVECVALFEVRRGN